MWTIKKISETLSVDTPVDKDIHVKDFKFDSRDIIPGDCFIALPGVDLNGHSFIQHARERGAVCVIGQKNADFIVPNSYEALNQLALYARNSSPAKRIAITGSVGKTTTTSFLAQILEQNHVTVSPQDSFNNHIGVPLTMTKLSPKTEFGVFEIGTNHPGEVRPLAELVKPDIAIITKIGKAHIGHFGDQKSIAEEKSQILHALPNNGIGIVPDDEFLSIYQQAGKKLIVVSPPQESLPDIPQRLQKNIVIAQKATEVLDIHDFDLTKLSVSQGRGAIYTQEISGKNVTIVDDAYNAAFDAIIASLEDFSTMKGRKILVIGDMGETGEFSTIYHEEVANKIRSLSNLACIIPIGPLMSAALKIPMHSSEMTIKTLYAVLTENDIILFKGSKASGTSKILHQITIARS